MASYAQTVLADGPVFYLRLNEAAGPTLADATGNNHPGTVNGTVTLNVAGGFAGLGTAATPGTTTSDFIGITAAAALDVTVQVTLECWYKPNSLATSAYLMTKGKDDPTHSSYGVFIATTGKVTFAWTEQINQVVSNTVLSVGTWYYIVCTVDGGGTWRIYINGAQDNLTSPGTFATATVKDYRIGGVVEGPNSPGTFFPMQGTIDEVALYSTALSASQISAHYAARNTAASAGPAIKKSPPPSVVARVGKQPHPSQGGPKGKPPAPSPLPEFGHLDGERRKREDQ